jgi:hypothetical protein
MITAGDEYPLHQTSRPVRDPGTDRNFYDRFFFNGYSVDGSLFFAVALGLYPGRNVMDAAFSVSVDGTQHNLRASRLLDADRLDTRVGPVGVEVREPLRRLSVAVDDSGDRNAGSGLGARLEFEARGPVFEEPHYLWKPGQRTLFDITRMTQNGTWSGEISLGPTVLRLDPATTWGTRDRSWGIRPVGEPEPPAAPDGPLGFYWLWAPINFPDTNLLFDVNEHPDGTRWHHSAMSAPVGDLDSPVTSGSAAYSIDYRSGTRHVEAARIEFSFGGSSTAVELTPISVFFMQGLGYTHPTWGHGMYRGEDARSYDRIELAGIDESIPYHQHAQTLCRAERSDGSSGMGVFEQLIIGPHQPSGLTGLLDMHA